MPLIVPFRFRTASLVALAAVTLVYAAAITFGNLRHIRQMPPAEREPLASLSELPGQVRILERAFSNTLSEPGLPATASPAESPSGSPRPSTLADAHHSSGLGRADVHVEINQQAFPASSQVWVQADESRATRARYLNRFRAGLLRYGEGTPESAESELWMYLVELHQDFAESGDEPRANLWRFPVEMTAAGAFSVPQEAGVRFAGNIKVSEAMAADWRALFADSYRRLVRAFPALAALIMGLAALGSLLFQLWRTQPWAVAATTVTFVLPLVSAAPFLAAFGWMPLVAAVVLGFIITTAIVCAIEQRLLPGVQERLRQSMFGRAVEALAIPLAALLVGTTLVTSLASVSVIEWQGLGSASPGDIFMTSLVRPAIGLLLGGLGGCLLLAGFYAVLQWRLRRLSADLQ